MSYDELNLKQSEVSTLLYVLEQLKKDLLNIEFEGDIETREEND